MLKKNQGFALLELLIVIVILVILTGIGLQRFGTVTDIAGDIVNEYNLRLFQRMSFFSFSNITPSKHFTVGNPSTHRIMSYDGNAGNDLIIPAEIDDVLIREIGHAAFDDNNLNSVILPETIEMIGALAFRNNNLTSIAFPAGLNSIGNIAFSDNKLTQVKFPSSVSSIGDGAFDGNNITRIVIGQGVQIGNARSLGNHHSGGGFKAVYESENRSAGTYIWNGTSWVKQ